MPQKYTASLNSSSMAGIYIHIPFCRKACHYCNFHFSTTLDQSDRMVNAIEKEIILSNHGKKSPIETIYFGGGTPSILSTKHLDRLLNTVYKLFEVNAEVEITMEANPDDITPEKAKAWKAMGINRFSIGIQSFFEEDLKWMNRAHDAQQSRRCIEIIKEEGFYNFSIDLIYGTPGQTHERWLENLDIAIQEKIPHLSCYALTVEEGTALYSMIKSGKKESVDSDEQSICFDALVQKTRDAGYRHYEISNLALPGMESKHNQSYWKGIPYWGFGPAAHSFDGKSRRWNVANNMEYMTSIENNKIPSEIEFLSEVDQLNEYIMTSLRCDTGINKNYFKHNWGEEKLLNLRKEINVSIELGRVIEDTVCFKLTDQGRFFADGIISSLFYISK